MKIGGDIIKSLNKKYITEVPVTISVKSSSTDFFSSHVMLIQRVLDRGSCLTLHDIEFRITAAGFWDKETFEDRCKYIFWTFNTRFLNKLLDNIENLNSKDLQSFISILRENPEPYLWVIDHPTDPYLHFCGKKLKSLNKKKYLDKAYETDHFNRKKLLDTLEHFQAASKRSAATQSKKLTPAENAIEKEPVETPLLSSEEGQQKTTSVEPVKESLPEEATPANIKQEKPASAPTTIPDRSKPFTALLRKPDLKKDIQDKITEAGIPFSLFQKVKTVGNNRNPDGFNSAVAVMIVVFRDLNYFKEGTFFDDILDAYLKETRNRIGKLSYFRRHYRENAYFQTYKENLLDLQLPKLQ